MDSFAANYIKPRGSNLKNMNASIITNKRQAQMVFTGYERQINAINDGFKTQRGAVVFNGSDGPALANLKSGDTWTSPETLHSIQTTNYCSLSNSCPPIPPPTYSITCSDVLGLQYISLINIEPFYISYDHTITNTGVVYIIFYQEGLTPTIIGSELINLSSSSLLVTPPYGTTWNNVGYVFRCTPINITYVDTNTYTIDSNYPYSFTNNSGSSKSLTLTKPDSSTILVQISDNDTYAPNPLYGYISYKFNL